MNKVLFDLSVCQPHGKSKFHGGGVYGKIVLRKFINVAPKQIIVFYNSQNYLEESIENDLIRNKILMVDSKIMSLKECILHYGIDTFYTPLFTKRYSEIESLKIKIIITIHGLRNQEMNRDRTEYLYSNNNKELFKIFLKQTPYYNKLKRKYHDEMIWLFTRDNTKIITVSNHSKYSIAMYYPSVDLSEIKVCYSPFTSTPGWQDTMAYSNEKYYFIVSGGRWVKNAYRAISALDNLFSNNLLTDKKVFITGLSKETKIYKRIKNKQRFNLLGYVSNDELESLYKGAYALLYPSLNEGFGYPPMEAMKYGVPVITSTFGAISEICGDSVLYTNPYSIDEIAIRLLELENQDIYKEYKKRSISRFELINKKQMKDLEDLVSFILE